jgi:hypothetical protein
VGGLEESGENHGPLSYDLLSLRTPSSSTTRLVAASTFPCSVLSLTLSMQGLAAKCSDQKLNAVLFINRAAVNTSLRAFAKQTSSLPSLFALPLVASLLALLLAL